MVVIGEGDGGKASRRSLVSVQGLSGFIGAVGINLVMKVSMG